MFLCLNILFDLTCLMSPPQCLLRVPLMVVILWNPLVTLIKFLLLVAPVNLLHTAAYLQPLFVVVLCRPLRALGMVLLRRHPNYSPVRLDLPFVALVKTPETRMQLLPPVPDVQQ